jgi:hypothetical protein
MQLFYEIWSIGHVKCDQIWELYKREVEDGGVGWKCVFGREGEAEIGTEKEEGDRGVRKVSLERGFSGRARQRVLVEGKNYWHGERLLIGKEGKGKVIPVLLLTEHHAMKAYWGMEVYLH